MKGVSQQTETIVNPTTESKSRRFTLRSILRIGENALWAFGRTRYGQGVLAAAGFATLAVPITNYEIGKAQDSIGSSAQAVQHSVLGKDVHDLTNIVQSPHTQETLNNINRYLPEMEVIYYSILQLQKEGIINLPSQKNGSIGHITHVQESSPASTTTTTSLNR